ncbi:MAG: 5'/3'-nucleotidase SurE [Candidatus Thorarchaeota archaeon]
MHKVCLTNDDGPYSQGMLKLADKIAEFAELTVVVPEGQRSATGKSLTLNRPLRVTERGKTRGYRLITHDGTPADSVVLAAHFLETIDLFVSGINSGANIGYQSMFTSGTVGAAFEATLKGYAAIAISQETGPDDWFDTNGTESLFEVECRVSENIIKRALEKGIPKGIDALNLNFPCSITEDTPLKITKPARVRMINRVVHRVDPHRRDYYWFEGVEKTGSADEDVAAVLKEGCISLSPIVIESVGSKELELLKDFMNE